MVSDEQWQAITNNDSNYDGQFWYAVHTTKIFCRPSCPSRLPNRDHISIFYDVQSAIASGFRPCKRCRPLNQIVDNQVWVKEIDEILLSDYQQNITLEELSARVHGSESYLRHVFQAETGLTPQQRLQQIRLRAARDLLKNTSKPIKQIAVEVGLENPAYFTRKFKEVYQVTPKSFRQSFNEI